MVTKRRTCIVMVSGALFAVIVGAVVLTSRPGRKDGAERKDSSSEELSVSLLSYSDNDPGFAPADRPNVLRSRSPPSPYALVEAGVCRGARPYTDREYVITELPDAFGGLSLLQTCNGHKGRRGDDFSITLSFSGPVTLFVAVDDRIASRWEGRRPRPEWLRPFRKTSYQIVTDDPVGGYGYTVFFTNVYSGKFMLGESGGSAADSMYFAFFCDLKTGRDIVEGAPPPVPGSEPSPAAGTPRYARSERKSS